MIITDHKYGAGREKQNTALSAQALTRGPWLSLGCEEKGRGTFPESHRPRWEYPRPPGELDYKSNLSRSVTPFDVRLVRLLCIISTALTDQRNHFQLSPPTWAEVWDMFVRSDPSPDTPKSLILTSRNEHYINAHGSFQVEGSGSMVSLPTARASVQKPNPLHTRVHIPVPYSSPPRGWSRAWSLQGLLPTSREDVRFNISYASKRHVSSQQTAFWSWDPSPVHGCLLVLKIFLQSTHCFLPSVPPHDTLTSYCFCMNKRVFPSEQRSRWHWERVWSSSKRCMWPTWLRTAFCTQ